EAPRDTPNVPPNAIFVADLFAGPEGQGAIIQYDPNTETEAIVADSSDGFLNQPVALTFRNGFLYAADCVDHKLIVLDPSQLLPNGHYQQSIVLLDGPGFNVPVGLMEAPGDTNSIYLADEGGYVDDPGQGQIWKFTFTDAT